MHCITLRAGIRVDDDGLAGDLCQLADEAADQLGSGAIDTDPDDLGLRVKQLRASSQCLSMGNVRSIPAGEAEIRRHIWIRLECGEDGPGFPAGPNAFKSPGVGS